MAYMWWNLAAVQGNENAKGNKDIIQDRMTPAQIEEAQTLIASASKKLLVEGQANVCVRLIKTAKTLTTLFQQKTISVPT